MKVVVTGGAGFIGSHLVDALVAKGAQVTVVDNCATGRPEAVNPGAKLLMLDICSDELRDFMRIERPDVVFHLAAQVDVTRSLADPVHDAKVNILGTVNLLEACRQTAVRKVVYASSSAVYGETQPGRTAVHLTEQDERAPISFYGVSKLTPEMYLRVYARLYGLSCTILRYANVYGPRQSAAGEGGVVAIFLDRLNKNQPLVVFGDGEQTRDFVYVQDVVSACLAAAADEGDCETLQVGTARPTTINQLIEHLATIHDTRLSVVRQAPRCGDIRHSCLDNARIGRVLGWQPQFSLREGLRETYRHVMDEPLNL